MTDYDYLVYQKDKYYNVLGTANQISRRRKEKIKELTELLREARELIIERGESHDVPLQFRQHGWLNIVKEILD